MLPGSKGPAKRGVQVPVHELRIRKTSSRLPLRALSSPNLLQMHQSAGPSSPPCLPPIEPTKSITNPTEIPSPARNPGVFSIFQKIIFDETNPPIISLAPCAAAHEPISSAANPMPPHRPALLRS